MDPEIIKQLSIALARDVAQDPRLSQMLTYLVRERPAGEGAVEFFNSVRRDLMNKFEGSPLPAKFPRTRALFRSLISRQTGLGQDWLADIIGGIADAVTTVWVTKETLESKEKIAELQAAMKAKEAAAQQAASEARAKEAEAAIQVASLPNVIQGPAGTAPAAAPAGAGLPSWLVPAGIAAGGLVLVLLLTR